MRLNNKCLSLVCVALFFVTACGCNLELAKQPGEAAFRDANRIIIRYEDKASHGNTQQAEELGAIFGESVSLLRDATIEEGGKSKFSLSRGRMLVYCQLTETHCAFLIHVPELRNFSREAKDLMAEICWSSAQAALQSQEITREHLAVGMKGMLLYDAIMIGRSDDDGEDPDSGLEERSDQGPSLYPFFADITKGETAEPGTADNLDGAH